MNETNSVQKPTPSVDASTIHLIINNAFTLAKYSLGAGVFLACFVLVLAQVRPESAATAAVVMTAAAGLLGGPSLAISAFFAMLARTRTEPQTPTGTPGDPLAVQGSDAPDAKAVEVTSATPADTDTTAPPTGQKDQSQ